MDDDRRERREFTLGDAWGQLKLEDKKAVLQWAGVFAVGRGLTMATLPFMKIDDAIRIVGSISPTYARLRKLRSSLDYQYYLDTRQS